jgi:hypothetical protein
VKRTTTGRTPSATRRAQQSTLETIIRHAAMETDLPEADVANVIGSFFAAALAGCWSQGHALTLPGIGCFAPRVFTPKWERGELRIYLGFAAARPLAKTINMTGKPNPSAEAQFEHYRRNNRLSGRSRRPSVLTTEQLLMRWRQMWERRAF